MASDHVTFWWITLGLGAVVISASILLLTLLLLFVKDVDRGVEEAWDMAARVPPPDGITVDARQDG